MLKIYKASELAKLEGKDARTIKNNHKKYIPIATPSKRAKKGYSIRYLRASDLLDYIKQA